MKNLDLDNYVQAKFVTGIALVDLGSHTGMKAKTVFRSFNNRSSSCHCGQIIYAMYIINDIASIQVTAKVWFPGSVNHGEKIKFPSPAAGWKTQKYYPDSRNLETIFLPVRVGRFGLLSRHQLNVA